MLVGIDLELSWGLCALAGRSLLSFWDARGVVARDCALRWDETDRVGTDLALVWNGIAVVGTNLGVLWQDLVRVGRTCQVVWNTTSFRASRDLELLWVINGPFQPHRNAVLGVNSGLNSLALTGTGSGNALTIEEVR